MTDPDYTLIVGILDRSGSMASIARATVDGWNELLGEQQAAGLGRVDVTLTQFDTYHDTLYTNVPIETAPRLYDDSRSTAVTQGSPFAYTISGKLPFHPRGGTALNDAIGKTVTSVGQSLAALPENQRPGNVVVIVLTDGGENASTEYSGATVKAIIKEQTDKYGWIFKFIGANQDAIAVGATLGVAAGQALTFAATHSGTTSAYASTSASILRGRTAKSAGASSAAVMDSYSYSQEEREAASE